MRPSDGSIYVLFVEAQGRRMLEYTARLPIHYLGLNCDQLSLLAQIDANFVGKVA